MNPNERQASATGTRSARRAPRIALAALLLLLAAPSTAPAGEKPCPNGEPRVGDLGLESLECDCTFRNSDGGRSRVARFRSEPVVLEVRDGGPAAGVLREGDAITAIDGVLITTSEGGRRFTNLQPGVPVMLKVRREDHEMLVKIVPGSVCASDAFGAFAPSAPVPPVPPEPALAGPREAPPAPPTPVVNPTPPAPPTTWSFNWQERSADRARREASSEMMQVVPRGWFGVSINCTRCGTERRPEDSTPVWSFDSPPEIYSVEPQSPAARSGVRPGDVLVSIDGVSIVSEDGGRRFGAVRPGQSVKWTVQRGGSTQNLTVVAGTRPDDTRIEVKAMLEQMKGLKARGDIENLDAQMQQLEAELDRLRAESASRSRRLRYAGSVGGSDVEVRGLGNVVVDDSGDEIVITTRDANIVIRPAAKTPKPKTAPKAAPSKTPAPKPDK
jgi:membrane-associated protease RseP (regulator of RpoE activity)